MSNEANLLDIVAVAKNIVSFMETRDHSFLNDVFASQETVLIDSFAPYVFQGKNSTQKWADGFINHAKNLTNLRHSFGDPQEYSSNDNMAFVSLPVTWEGESDYVPFYETGGLALAFVKMDGRWKVQNYAWAATSFCFK